MKITNKTILILSLILWAIIPQQSKADSVDKTVRIHSPSKQGKLFYKKKKLRVGLIESYAPSFIWNNDSTPSGFNTDVAMAVMEEANLRYSFYIGKAEKIRNMLYNNELDAIIGYFFIRERETKLLFSMPFRDIDYRMAVNDDSPYKRPTDFNLPGIKVAMCQEDQIKEYDLSRFLNKVEIVHYNSYKEAMYAVYNGECTAMIKMAVGKIYPDTIGDKVLRQMDNAYDNHIDNTISTSIKDPELMETLNAALFRLIENGTLPRIHNQWMPKESKTKEISSWENILTLAVVSLFFLLFTLILILIRMYYERKKSKRQRINSQELLNKLPIPLFILSLKNDFLVYEFINDQVRKMNDYTTNNLSDYIKMRQHSERLIKGCHTAINTRKTISIVDERHDNKQFMIYLNACLYQGRTCIVKTWINTEELLQLKEKAEENDRKMDDFLANISHEVRTPLNAIVGFSHLLPDMSEEEREMSIEMIQQKSVELNKLINDILLISKFESDTLHGKYIPTNVIQTIQAFVNKTISEYPQEINIPIICDNYYSDLEQVMDIDFGYYVVNNLLSNAIKFTQSGEIHVGFVEVEGDSVLYVHDTGIGIPKEKQEEVFDKFTKINTFTQGTGLGIPIALAIMHTCAGQIGVYSEEGQGSLFWISYNKPWIKKVVKDAAGLETRKAILKQRWNGYWIDCRKEEKHVELQNKNIKKGGVNED